MLLRDSVTPRAAKARLFLAWGAVGSWHTVLASVKKVDEDEVTEASEGKSLEEDNEVVEASREESKEEDAVRVENVEAREGKSIVDEDNMLIRTKQARKGPFDNPMDGIFTLTTQNARNRRNFMF